MTGDRVDAVFSALADPTRRAVIRALSESGPVTATQLAAALPVTRQAVAKHLEALAEAGLAEGVRTGREKRYRLTPAPLSEAVAWMAVVGAEWDGRLEALRRHLGPGS
ncbi:MAG: winged helix-turn-helix domain-containing protein [Actinomycetota bacterium]|nr:winged helix-turn-helix domain-containing protein [Actinomycetota bacterium]